MNKYLVEVKRGSINLKGFLLNKEIYEFKKKGFTIKYHIKETMEIRKAMLKGAKYEIR